MLQHYRNPFDSGHLPPTDAATSQHSTACPPSLLLLLLPLDPALDDTLQRRLVLLDCDLARGLVQERVGLHKDLARLLVGDYHWADLATPVLHTHGRHLFKEELVACLDVRGGLVDVQLLEEIADGW